MEAMQEMIRYSQARGLDRVVGMAVAWHAHRKTNLSWPSNETLMEWGLSERRIQNGLRKLEALGELRPQPHLEDHRRRRVYLVDARAGLQLSLLDSAGDRVHVVQGAPCAPAPEVAAGAPMRARVRNHLEPTTSNPPQPPLAGGELAGVTYDLQQSGPSPRVTTRVEREAPARRRRRRRAANGDAHSLTSEPCPLHDVTVSAETDRTLLKERWEPLEAQIIERLGGSYWAMWGAGAHLHAAEHELVLALQPHAVEWVNARVGPILADVVDVPLRLVGCHRATNPNTQPINPHPRPDRSPD
jgi:hypothetical protein